VGWSLDLAVVAPRDSVLSSRETPEAAGLQQE